jgi:hypothetical protein
MKLNKMILGETLVPWVLILDLNIRTGVIRRQVYSMKILKHVAF